MEEEMWHEIIKWQVEGLRYATGILERVKKTENKGSGCFDNIYNKCVGIAWLKTAARWVC
jgi:hypothetical protein